MHAALSLLVNPLPLNLKEAQPDFTRANHTMKLFLDTLRDGGYLSETEHIELGEYNLGKVVFDLMWDGQVISHCTACL